MYGLVTGYTLPLEDKHSPLLHISLILPFECDLLLTPHLDNVQINIISLYYYYSFSSCENVPLVFIIMSFFTFSCLPLLSCHTLPRLTVHSPGQKFHFRKLKSFHQKKCLINCSKYLRVLLLYQRPLDKSAICIHKHQQHKHVTVLGTLRYTTN